MKPFLKWVGGKARSVDSILEVLPEKIENYYEPFLGGGKVFFELAARGRFRKAFLSDTNRELIDTFSVVRDCCPELIEALQRFKRKPLTEAAYYRLRNAKPKDRVARAARMIVLNKTGFSGLYRVNRSGGFNTPFGSYKNPRIFDEGNLKACSELLQGVCLIDDHYLWAVAAAEPGDAVYLDPPYLQPSKPGKSAGFSSYTTAPFDLQSHWRLAHHTETLTRRGVAWAASNADTSQARQYYQGLNVRTLEVGRTVSSKVETRKPVNELLIWNRPETAGKVKALHG